MELFENALQTGGIWKRWLCVLVWKENIFFENIVNETRLQKRKRENVFALQQCIYGYQWQEHDTGWTCSVQSKQILSAMLTSKIKFSTHKPTINNCINDVNQRLKREEITRILVPNTLEFSSAWFFARAIEKMESNLLTCIIYVYVTVLQARKPNAHLFAWGPKNAIRQHYCILLL